MTRSIQPDASLDKHATEQLAGLRVECYSRKSLWGEAPDGHIGRPGSGHWYK
jgi:hypothetical protein